MKYIGWIFVFLWASGYIASSIGLLHSNPLTFITLRVGIVSLIFFLIFLAYMKKLKPLVSNDLKFSAVVGIFMQFLYPVFFSYALSEGISPAMLTIILGLQPVLSLILLRDFSSKVQIVGVIGCLLGTVIFSYESFHADSANLVNLTYAILSLLGVTFGTMIQKKYCNAIPLELNMLVQCICALTILVPTTIVIDGFYYELNYQFAVSLLWQAVLISLLSTILLIKALRSNTVTNVSTYFSCVPAATALMSYFVLDSVLTTNMIIGMAFIFSCTCMVNHPDWL